jgi:hypothetical protein
METVNILKCEDDLTHEEQVTLSFISQAIAETAREDRNDAIEGLTKIIKDPVKLAATLCEELESVQKVINRYKPVTTTPTPVTPTQTPNPVPSKKPLTQEELQELRTTLSTTYNATMRDIVRNKQPTNFRDKFISQLRFANVLNQYSVYESDDEHKQTMKKAMSMGIINFPTLVSGLLRGFRAGWCNFLHPAVRGKTNDEDT